MILRCMMWPAMGRTTKNLRPGIASGPSSALQRWRTAQAIVASASWTCVQEPVPLRSLQGCGIDKLREDQIRPQDGCETSRNRGEGLVWLSEPNPQCNATTEAALALMRVS